MTWARIDDGYFDHPKISGLSQDAQLLHLRAILYSSRFLTDGVVPAHLLKVFVKKRVEKVVKELISCSLFVQKSDGNYEIKDYLEYQSSKKDVEELKEEARKRAQKYRDSKKNSTSVTETSHMTRHDAYSEITEPPTPTPTPTPTPNLLKDISASQSSQFDEFWLSFPRKTAKGIARVSFIKALGKTSFNEILAGAVRLANDSNLDLKYCPHPSTWLNQERWSDGPLPPRFTLNRDEQRQVQSQSVKERLLEKERQQPKEITSERI